MIPILRRGNDKSVSLSHISPKFKQPQQIQLPLSGDVPAALHNQRRKMTMKPR